MPAINKSPQKLKDIFFAAITVPKRFEEPLDKALLCHEFKFAFVFKKFTLTISCNQKRIKYKIFKN